MAAQPHLQDPVGAADKAGQAQREHVVRGELLDHFGALHHAQLRQHADCLQVHAQRPHYLRICHSSRSTASTQFCRLLQAYTATECMAHSHTKRRYRLPCQCRHLRRSKAQAHPEDKRVIGARMRDGCQHGAWYDLRVGRPFQDR